MRLTRSAAGRVSLVFICVSLRHLRLTPLSSPNGAEERRRRTGVFHRTAYSVIYLLFVSVYVLASLAVTLYDDWIFCHTVQGA